MPSELKIDCVESRAQLDELEADWDRLLGLSDVASPFLTPGWQRAWLDTYGRGRKLVVFVARRDGALVGLWPLSVVRRGVFRVLEPIGAGRSDWLDVLCTAQDRAEVLESFIHALARRKSTWDLLECRDVLSESPAIALLGALSGKHGIQFRHEERTAAPYLALAESWEQFLKSKRPKFRTNLNYYRRLAERTSQGFSISRHEWRSDDAVVGELADVELRSWKAQEGNLKVSTVLGREFYARVCQYFSSQGQLDLWRADGDGKLIAFLVNFRYGGKCYHYNTCFDQQFAPISPGLLLHATAIADAFDHKLTEYDFLSGDEPYKERWSSAKRQIMHLAMYNGRLQSKAAFTCLVAARWAFRRSERLRAARAKVLAAVRKLLRRGES